VVLHGGKGVAAVSEVCGHYIDGCGMGESNNRSN
jgi:hypothetical protein